MRRLISLLMALTLVTAWAVADTQSDFNKYIKAYNSQMASRQYLPAARSAVGAASACAEARNYDGAFKLLAGMEKIMAEHGVLPDSLPAPYYHTAKGRYLLYQKMGNHAQAEAWLKKMAPLAKKAGGKNIASDMLFTEAQYYYSVDRTQLGDQCIARLIKQYETSKDYTAADKAYKELIDRAVSADDARLVEHTYESYMRWSDSIEAINADTELGKVKQEVEENEATIASKNHTITARTSLMTIFIALFVISLAVLGVGVMLYFRVVRHNRSMRRRVVEADERNAAKDAMLQNMSSSMEPALSRLDQNDPAVQDIRGYVKKVEELSEVEAAPMVDPSTLDNVNLEPFCQELADEVRPILRKGVSLHLEGTKGYARINAPEVRKILEYLLDNAAKFTPEGGKITLAYKKRGAHIHQFIVTDTGSGIPEDERESLFKAFNASHDISDGDGLGLPICAKRAEKLNGSLTLDPTVTKGTSFILTMHT